jgi:hypothetical protein
MSERITDERFDLELRRFLAWQADDVHGAPSPADVAAALGARGVAGRRSVRLTPALAGLMLLLALLITAMLGALVAAELLRRDDPLGDHSPISLGVGAWEELVAGHDGRVWSSGEQGISVYDPSTGETRVFGLADDPLLAGGRILAAAADGGVWLGHWASGGVVRFDGAEFGDPISFPGGRICGISDVDELVVLGCDGTIARLEDSAWTTLTDSYPDRHAWGLSLDDAGAFWVIGSAAALEPARVWEHRAGTWTSHEMDPALAVDMKGLAVASDGSVWVWGTLGVVRHDGSAWRTLFPGDMGGGEISSLALAADGSVWTATGDAWVAHHHGGARTTYHVPWDGGPHAAPQVVVSGTEVFASAGGGLAQLVVDRFTVVDPGPPGTLRHVESIAVDALGVAWLLTSGDDHSPGMPRRVGRIVENDYEELNQSGEAIRLGADDRIWVATPEGPMRLEDGSFELVGPPISLSSATEDEAWHELPPYAIGGDGTPYTVVRGGTDSIVQLAGGAWQELPHAELAGAITAIAVAPDDALWVAVASPEVALLRLSGSDWSTVALPARSLADIVSIAFDRDGTAWFDVGLTVNCTEDHFFGLRCRASRGVARLESGEWTVFDEVAGESLGDDARHPERRRFGDLAIAPEGTVWLATERGVSRFDGQHWRLIVEVDRLADVAAGPDGSVWAGGVGIHRLGSAADGSVDD